MCGPLANPLMVFIIGLVSLATMFHTSLNSLRNTGHLTITIQIDAALFYHCKHIYYSWNLMVLESALKLAVFQTTVVYIQATA